MGVPRFGELIRRRFGKCWFQEGRANVLTNRPGQVDLSVEGMIKRRDVDTLFVDGNGLLHPAMQYTFGYGSFEDQKRREENSSKTEEQLIVEGTDHFMNAIESLCMEFRPSRLVLAIDGSAPIAKMIQQRQRRFGAKIDVSNDPSLNSAWEATLRRAVKNTLQEEGSYVSVTIEFDASRRDFGEGLINTRLELLQAETPQDKIFRALIENLVKGKGQGERVRWYNVLSPETPLGFRFEDKWWYSVAMAATALAWRDVWKQTTYISLFGMDSEPEIGINRNNKYIYGTGKITTTEDSPVYGYVEEFRRFRANNSDFLVRFANRVAHYCEKIGDYLVESQPIYRETLLLTGFGTNLENLEGRRIEWLMNVRAKIFQRLEMTSETASSQVDYPEYEGGFRGVEGVMNVSKFDSNSLTPGTKIMNTIDRNIRKRFTRDGRITISKEDGYSVDVLYSAHTTPGEGEHKIENLIDREKRDMSGKVSLVYGLDADLFMLSMVRDYPICLIRENSLRTEKFLGKVPQKVSSKVASCHLVDIERLKRLLLDEGEDTGVSVHPLDFTFICFLFGNDFLRNVPGLLFDDRLQIAFGRKKDEESEDPILFDYIFDVYEKLRKGKGYRKGQPMFVTNGSDILKINWIDFYDYIDELANVERNIIGGLIRKMQMEEEKEKSMTQRVPDYVPVSLRYNLLKKAIVERQVIKGGVIDQRAEWVRGVDAFDIDEFRNLWRNHMTSNIPGFDEKGVVRNLTGNKDDVVERICRTYLEGMEWAMRYYTNRHSYVDSRTNIRKSILDVKWYYPYFQAPLLSQLKTELGKFIMEDARRIFVQTRSDDVEQGLRVLFEGKRLRTSPSISKLERDMLETLPNNYFEDYRNRTLSQPVRERLANLMSEHRKNLERTDNPYEKQYSYILKRYGDSKYNYRGENVFVGRWAIPRALHGSSENTLLIAPSSTNHRVQLLAVLPQQSFKLFPDGILPTDPAISWMFPTGIPVDFTFRDRVHASILMIPPPNIEVLENHIRETGIRQAVEQVQEGMFPREVKTPSINQNALRKISYYDSFLNILDDEKISKAGTAIDVFGGVGVSTLALAKQFERVVVFEHLRENVQDLRKNVDQISESSRVVVRNEHFNPAIDFDPDTGLVCMDLVHEGRSGGREIRIEVAGSGREGVPLEGVMEEIIERFRQKGLRSTLTLVVKIPRNKTLKKIVTDLPVKTRFMKDTVGEITLVYAIVVVNKQEEENKSNFYDVDYGY